MARKKKTSKKGPPRRDFLESLKDAFGAEVTVYAMASRRPLNLFGGQLANDVLPVIGRHLEKIGQVKKIALVLHTQGGSLNTPWPLVSMIRHHAERFLVLVPEFALSAGTLVALGADEVWMLPHAFLSPVDPKGTFESEPGKTEIYSIEDVMGYVDFVTERVGIRDQEALVDALKELTKEVKATILGSIHRTRFLIERLSRSMLQLHLTSVEDQKRVDEIVDMLTHRLFGHQHMIPVREAQKAIGLPSVKEAVGQRRQAMLAARRFIRAQLKDNEPFDPEPLLKEPKKKAGKGGEGSPTVILDATRALVYSRAGQDAFVSRYRLARDEQGRVQIRPGGVPAWQAVSKGQGDQ